MFIISHQNHIIHQTSLLFHIVAVFDKGRIGIVHRKHQSFLPAANGQFPQKLYKIRTAGISNILEIHIDAVCIDCLYIRNQIPDKLLTDRIFAQYLSYTHIVIEIVNQNPDFHAFFMGFPYVIRTGKIFIGSVVIRQSKPGRGNDIDPLCTGCQSVKLFIAGYILHIMPGQTDRFVTLNTGILRFFLCRLNLYRLFLILIQILHKHISDEAVLCTDLSPFAVFRDHLNPAARLNLRQNSTLKAAQHTNLSIPADSFPADLPSRFINVDPIRFLIPLNLYIQILLKARQR